MSALPPVRKSVVVPLDADAAFDLFVRRLPEWWPLEHRSATESPLSCHVEPEVGGRLYEKLHDGGEAVWGVFRIVESPARAVFSWHPGLPASAATEVEITFTPLPRGTRVDIEHRDWERLGARAEMVRGRYDGGWVGVLSCYVALASGTPEAAAVGEAASCRSI